MKTLLGIDVSNHNSGLDYTNLAKSINFVVIQSSYGTTRNPMFLTHVNGFRAAKVSIPGVYHFIYAISREQVVQNAQKAIKSIQEAGLPKDTRIWADFEYDSVDYAAKRGITLGAEECNEYTKIFCETVQAAGYPTGIYCNIDFYENWYSKELLNKYPIWLCDLSGKCKYPCLMWQYSWKGFDWDIWFKSEDGELTDGELIDAGEPKTVDEAIDRLLSVAEAEVGYREKASPYNLDDKDANAGNANYTKYGRIMHSVQPSNMDYPAAWCFTKGTLVLTDKGYKPIEEINIGDKVVNAYGDSFNEVTHTSKRVAPVRKFRAYGSLELFSTEDHPFLSNQRLGVRKDWKHTELGFHSLKDLKHLDNVVIPITAIENNLDLTQDEAWIVGYFVGDGWKTSRDKYKLCGNDKKETEIYKHIEHIKKDKDYESRTCHEYTIDEELNANIIPLLDEVGIGAENKKVPASILFASVEIKKAFIEGYLTADGDKTGQFSTVSRTLAIGILKLAYDIGFGCSIREQHRKEDQKIYDKRIGDYRSIKIKPVIYCGKINNNSSKRNRMDRVHGNLVYVPVKYNDETGNEDTVYNITTNGDHTYLANNLAVHNCDCFVDWCFYTTFGADLARRMLCGDFDDYTVNSANLYKNAGRWYTSGKRGDQIFFRNDSGICHTGLVEKVSGGIVYTIEGNKSNAVRKCQYHIYDSTIAGYGRPRYDLALAQQEERYMFTTETVRRGSKGASVLLLQKLLKAEGYTGSTGAVLELDGDFGGNTEAALKEYQRKHAGLAADGICGPATWESVLGL